MIAGRILLLITISLVTSCGYEDWRESDCYDGCEPPENYYEPSPSPVVQSVGQPGPAGRDGEAGPAGVPGSAGSTGPAGPRGLPGTAGVDGLQGADGVEGATGAPGAAGNPGADGSSCSATTAIGGVLISCTDGSSAVVLNGSDGAAGADAPPTPFTVTEMIDPCGDQTAYDEILMRLANDQLVAHFSSGSLEFLTTLPPGNYVTTDGTHCYFTVEPDLSITGEHN